MYLYTHAHIHAYLSIYILMLSTFKTSVQGEHLCKAAQVFVFLIQKLFRNRNLLQTMGPCGWVQTARGTANCGTAPSLQEM